MVVVCAASYKVKLQKRLASPASQLLVYRLVVIADAKILILKQITTCQCLSS